MHESLNALQKIGFSTKEGQVYLASVEIGAAPVQDIAKKADVNRATTYVVIESLLARGLMSVSQMGKKRIFTATSPEVILKVLHGERRQLDDKVAVAQVLVKDLQVLSGYANKQPKMSVYEGVAGIEEIRKIILNCGATEAYEFFPADLALAQFPLSDGDHRSKFDHFKCRVIYTSSKGPVFKNKNDDKFIFVPAHKMPFDSDVTIVGDYVSVVNYRPKLLGVLIENASMADTFRQMFSLMWKGAKK